MVLYLAIIKAMICIVLSLLNLLQPVLVELLGLVVLPMDHQSLYVSLLLRTCTCSLLLAKCGLCFLSTGRLCFFSNTNNILEYGLILTKPTFLTDTSILIENQHASLAPVICSTHGVEETRGRRVSPFITMIIRVFGGKGSTEEILKLAVCAELLLLINLLSFAFFLPINKEYLDDKLSRSTLRTWLQKWVKTTNTDTNINTDTNTDTNTNTNTDTNTDTKKSEKEKNSFFLKTPLFQGKEKEFRGVYYYRPFCCVLLCCILCGK